MGSANRQERERDRSARVTSHRVSHATDPKSFPSPSRPILASIRSSRSLPSLFSKTTLWCVAKQLTLDPAPAPVLRRIPAYAGRAGDAGDARDAGDAGDALLALLNIPHHHPSQPIAGAALYLQRTRPSPRGKGRGAPRSLVMSVSHHSSEAFILTPRVSIIPCVCSRETERECVLLFFAPRIAASCCSRSWLGGAGLHRGDLYPLVWWLATEREKARPG